MREQDKKSTVHHFRTSNRYFCQDGRWWFSTREGEEGPFDTRELAEEGMQRFVGSVQLMEKFQATRQAKKDKNEKAQRDRGDPTIWDRQLDSR